MQALLLSAQQPAALQVDRSDKGVDLVYMGVVVQAYRKAACAGACAGCWRCLRYKGGVRNALSGPLAKAVARYEASAQIGSLWQSDAMGVSLVIDGSQVLRLYASKAVLSFAPSRYYARFQECVRLWINGALLLRRSRGGALVLSMGSADVAAGNVIKIRPVALQLRVFEQLLGVLDLAPSSQREAAVARQHLFADLGPLPLCVCCGRACVEPRCRHAQSCSHAIVLVCCPLCTCMFC
jgi:hypothetical protein